MASAPAAVAPTRSAPVEPSAAIQQPTSAALPISSSPFSAPLPADHARDAVWAEPVLVAEITFTGWTRAGRMRAPSYQGLRSDKDPAEVVREP